MRQPVRKQKPGPRIQPKPAKPAGLPRQGGHWLLDLQRTLGNRVVVGALPELRVPASSPTIQLAPAGHSEHDVDGQPASSPPLSGWASEHGGKSIPTDKMAISAEELKEIYPQLAKDAAKDPPKVTEDQIASFAYYLSEAFQLMRLDTVEAQAGYLAHGAVESDQFRRFTETQNWKQWYEEDPTAVRLDTGWLNTAADNPRYPSYKMGGTINPNKDKSWQSSYIGRGPVQVTHQYNYNRTLKQMEQFADEYEAAGQSASAATLREAVTAIRADPRQAANPRYTFLFSAAYEKWSGGEKDVVEAGEKATFSGSGPESRWVTGGAREDAWKAKLKAGAWRRALEVLGRKASPEPDTDPATYKGPSSDRSASHIPA